jgi:hypothetical protein
VSLPDPRGDAAWTDPEHPPLFGSKPPVDHGGGIWSVWLDKPYPYLWHWCAHTWPNLPPGPHVHALGESRWQLTGVGAHNLVATDPLTLSPSVYWPECCGKHGFLTDGVWRDV